MGTCYAVSKFGEDMKKNIQGKLKEIDLVRWIVTVILIYDYIQHIYVSKIPLKNKK